MFVGLAPPELFMLEVHEDSLLRSLTSKRRGGVSTRRQAVRSKSESLMTSIVKAPKYPHYSMPELATRWLDRVSHSNNNTTSKPKGKGFLFLLKMSRDCLSLLY